MEKCVMGIDIGLKNFAYCVIAKKTKKIYKWELIDLLDEKKCIKCKTKATWTDNDILYCYKHKDKSATKIITKHQIQNMTECILSNMDDILNSLDNITITQVNIENQPFKNAKMKMVSHIIYAFFVYKKIDKVVFSSPRNKTKGYTTITKKSSYRQRKQDAIDCCLELLKEYEMANDWINHINKFKKKDDLADAFWYCVK